MENKDFVHLHVHSDYSLFDGMAPIDKLVMQARKMGFKALALTDHGAVGGWLNFIKQCNATKDKKGEKIPYPTIKPILGSEMYLARCIDGNKENQPDGRKGNRHLVLLAKNVQGYKNLCTLNNLAWTKGFYYDPRIDIETLEKYSEGLVCSSACLSNIINANLSCDRYDEAKKAAQIFKDIFGEDFILEVMYHGIANQHKIAPSIFEIGRELDIPVIATNDVHYITKDQAHSQEVLTCMSRGTCIQNPKRMSQPYDEFYLKSAEEMNRLFGDFPETMSNTVSIASKIDAKGIEKYLFGGMRLPKFDIPEKFKTTMDYLRHLSYKGLKERGWDKSQKHIDRLELELNDVQVAWDVNGYDFATYFLIVQDYIIYAKENGILIAPGRGSGYGSVLLHCIDICYGLDPLEYSLLWERFLGFDDKQYIKDNDLGLEENDTVIPYKTMEEIKRSIFKGIQANLDEKAIENINCELETMEITEGLNDKNNLIQFYDIWKSHLDESGDKNEINSWTAYYLGMTTEKPSGDFLPPRRAYARAGFPDIDTDIDDSRRDEIFEYLFDKYGIDYVSRIGTYGKMGFRAGITRIVKALDIAGAFHKGPEAYKTENVIKVNEILKSIPRVKGALSAKDFNTGELMKIKTIEDAMRCFKEFHWFMSDKYPEILECAKNIEGLIQNFGIHAAGIVVSDVPLNELVPIRSANTGMGSQYTMQEIESLGLIKFDALSVSMLSTVSRTVQMIKDKYDIDIDIGNLPVDDKKVFNLYQTGNLTGIFQCEEAGMQKTMQKVGVTSFNDIMATVALYRPGPIKFVPTYCDRKHGREPVDYFHPTVEKFIKPYLEKTYGIMIYQEQLMFICHKLCNFSITDGYILIKAVGKKKESLLKRFRDQVIKGGMDNGVPQQIMERYWDECIIPFADYGFNASHACCYGYLSYISAYLKTYYKEEFMCCLLNVENNRKKHELIEGFEKHLKKCGIKLLPKDLNKCGVDYRVAKKADASLGEEYSEFSPSLMVKGIGRETAQEIENNIPYDDLREFATKTKLPVGKEAVGCLYDAGFFKIMFKRNKKKVTRESLVDTFSAIREDLKRAASRGVISGDMFG